jgi:hypothetical protein
MQRPRQRANRHFRTMKKLARLLIGHVRTDVATVPYAATILIVSAAVFVNYSPLVDLWPRAMHGSNAEQAAYIALLYGGIYFLTALFCQDAHGPRYLRDPRFYAVATVLICLVSVPKLSVLQPFSFRTIEGLSKGEMVFGSRCQFFVWQGVVAFGGLLLLSLFHGGFKLREIGLTARQWDAGPYLLVLAIVLPLVVIASFAPDFQRAYPQYKSWMFPDVFGLGPVAQAGIFELCYGSAFLTVEVLFRGALVIGMARIMGPRAILPAVAMYCTFHFGKPLGEAIGSVVGGYILSVFALHSRSVLGGVVVHLGVALGMELCAYAQHMLR